MALEGVCMVPPIGTRVSEAGRSRRWALNTNRQTFGADYPGHQPLQPPRALQHENLRPWDGSVGPSTPPRGRINIRHLDEQKGYLLGVDSAMERGNYKDREPIGGVPTTPRLNGENNFGEAMKTFMRNYQPISPFLSAKPVRDWSKEAGNLIQELTDNESHSDPDVSVWNISRLQNKNGCASQPLDPWLTAPPEDVHQGEELSFDIHRHIMSIDPSPYLGSSPVSSSQLSSNHSSDNDADDEGAQSATESLYTETTGAKKNQRKRFYSSFTASTIDSGYLSSATNEGDPTKIIGMDVRAPGRCVESDEVNSECGFTSSTCPSWPSSPSRSTNPGHPADINARKLPDFLLSRSETSSEMGDRAVIQKPQSRVPVPPPMPHFMPTIPGFPIPPPPQLLPPRFPQTLSIHSSAYLAGMPPPPWHASSGVAFVASAPPSYNQHRAVNQPRPLESEKVNGTYHKHKAWITDEILEMIAVRDRLYKRMKKHPAPDIVEMYKKVRNMVVGMTRNAKRSYEKQLEERIIEQQLQNTRQVDDFRKSGGGRSESRVLRTW